MTAKTCTKCGQEKPLGEFHREARSSDGRQPRCKECRADANRKNRIKIREYNRKYREDNSESLKAYRSQYYKENKEKFKQRHREYYAKNRSKKKEYVARWQKENKAHRRAYERDYVRRRRASDPQYKARLACRNALWNTLYRTGKPETYFSVSRALGYSKEDLIRAIESRFRSGMSWDNHGEWHIDHKIPVAHFVRKGETRPHIINALCNLQPIWAEENWAKSDRHPLREA